MSSPHLKILSEVSRFVVGKLDLLKHLLIAILSEGHILLEGPTGTGKTHIARTFAQTIGGTFKRIQMTPDLLPADIIGTTVYNISKGVWDLKQGPIFANIVLIDELNRATPKTQAALIEAMQERQVTIEGQTIPLPTPFLILATQLPYGEGTYPLSDVQIDRFAYRVDVKYPEFNEEIEIISKIDLFEKPSVNTVVNPRDIMDMVEKVRGIYVSDRVKKYIVEIVNKIRSMKEIRIGPGPRASIWIYKGSRALAFIEGRGYVIPDDVKKIALLAIPHRLRLKPEVDIEPIEIVRKALEEVEVPKL